MANLNFQQPPRSIANSSLNNRSAGNVGIGGNVGVGVGVGVGVAGAFVSAGANSLSGHVTPTSGMFQPSNAGFGSQLSPNRSNNVQLGGVFSQNLGSSVSSNSGNANPNRSTLLRSITDRRMQGIGPMVI